MHGVAYFSSRLQVNLTLRAIYRRGASAQPYLMLLNIILAYI